MITPWRLVRAETAYDPFTGIGAAEHPGRWNLRGTKLIYSSESHALATIEILVNLSGIQQVQNYYAYPIYFDEKDCLEINISDLPKTWNSPQAAEYTRELGSMWAKSNESPALKVPSAPIPTEYNYLINPSYPHFKKAIKLGKKTERIPLKLDPRLL